MSFQTGLSGLNASSRNLDVIGNNIANANTVGMKSSRTEFADLVASSLGVGGNGGGGIGVSIATISQQFSQGSISITGNNLDVAINGNGFFRLEMQDGTSAYTRDGQFKLDKLGNLITNTGANVMGYPTDTLGATTSVTPEKMVIPTNAPIPANATTAITTSVLNLDARAKVATSVSPPTPITKYGTSLTAFDSQGVEVPVSLYFVKVGPDAAAVPPVTVDTWNVFDATTMANGATQLTANAATYTTNTANLAWNAVPANAADPLFPKPTLANGGLTTAPAGEIFQMTFDTKGAILTPTTAQSLTLTSPNTAIGTFTAALDVTKASQHGTDFSVALTQDGYTAGELTGITIDDSGVINTTYSNGQTQAKGQLALADFRNVQGLSPTGGGNWVSTFTSGAEVLGSAGQGKFGGLRAGALEESNVDLTGELVNMMVAQRAYQANAQTIKTQDQIMTTLVNLR